MQVRARSGVRGNAKGPSGTTIVVEQLVQIAAGVLGLLNTPSVSVYWLYLLTAAALATVVYVRAFRRRATLRGWLGFLFPRRILGCIQCHQLPIAGADGCVLFVFPEQRARLVAG